MRVFRPYNGRRIGQATAPRRYADVERRLGEVDRARAIYGHAAQFCDPRVEAAFWQAARRPRRNATGCVNGRATAV